MGLNTAVLVLVLLQAVSPQLATAQEAAGPDQEANVEDALTFDSLTSLRSSRECAEERPELNICKYYNLVVFGGTLYYLSDVPEELEPLLVSLRSDEAEVWVTPKVVAPGKEPWSWQTHQVLAVTDAVINNLPSSASEFALLGELLPSLHNVLCAHLGRCYYQNDASQSMVLSLAPDYDVAQLSPIVREAFLCLSNVLPVGVHNPAVMRQVLVVRRAMVGYGATCMAQDRQCSGEPGRGYGRAPMDEHVVFALHVRMFQCQQLDWEEEVLIQPPRVLVLDREYGAGRQLLNSAEVMHEIYHRWYRSVEVVYFRLEGQSLAELADAVFRSAIVLATYGEALALVMPFLRQRAVVVHVAEQPGHEDMHAYVRQWVEGLAPQAGTSLVEVTNTYVNNIVIDLERLATRDWWQLLSAGDKLNLLEHKACPEGVFQAANPATGQPLPSAPLVDVHERCLHDVLHGGGCNLVLDLQQLEEALQAAFFHLSFKFAIPSGMAFPFPLGSVDPDHAANNTRPGTLLGATK